MVMYRKRNKLKCLGMHMKKRVSNYNMMINMNKISIINLCLKSNSQKYQKVAKGILKEQATQKNINFKFQYIFIYSTILYNNKIII